MSAGEGRPPATSAGKDRASATSADDVIAAFGLVPHPEGGWYRETFRDGSGAADGPARLDEGAHGRARGRAHSTAIYYLLRAGERSHWHRVDAAEVWHHYAGAPLRLRLWPGEGVVEGAAAGRIEGAAARRADGAVAGRAEGAPARRADGAVEGVVEGTVEEHTLGGDLAGGQRPQVVVPARCWQAADPLGPWTLVGCTVAPGFDFAGFEMAPRDWEPPRNWEPPRDREPPPGREPPREPGAGSTG